MPISSSKPPATQEGKSPEPSANGRTGNGRQHNYARVFQAFGVDVSVNGSAEAWADACPWCDKDRFSINITSGLYHCKHCDEGGNIVQYLTWVHGEYLKATESEHYLQLQKKRGIAHQTLELHKLAYDASQDRWLIPFRSSKGNVVNILSYYPNKSTKPDKYLLPELPSALYGFDRLVGTSKDKIVFLCEGPFDAIALDYSIGHRHRNRYAIVASPGAFKAEWAEHFRDRKVRALYDNDKGGEQHRNGVQKILGESGIAEELMALKWPADTPDGCDINDLVRHPDFKGKSVVGFLLDHSYKVVPQPKLDWDHGWDRKSQEPEVIDWIWPNRLRCGTYASFSGRRGALKSTAMREIAALYTQGRPLPACDEVGLPAGHVIYITAEDSKGTAWASLELAGANLDLVTVLPAILKDGNMMNVLEHLPELRQVIRQYGTRLVIIDGQNSVVGAPCIASDMLARHNVTGPLHQFAQRENICLVGIRNEDTEGRAYGPASMSDLGRCILRAVELPKVGDDRYFELIFERISDVSPIFYPPLPYSVEDLGGSARKILWGKTPPEPKSLTEALARVPIRPEAGKRRAKP